MSETKTEIGAPRSAPALRQRRRWEQEQYLRIALTEAAILAGAIGAGLAAARIAGEEIAARTLQALVLFALWMVLLAGMRTRGSDVLGSGITEYRRVVHASGLALGLFAVCGILLDWGGMRVTLFLVGPAALLGLLVARLLWRRWLHRQRMRGRYVNRTLVVGFEDDVRYVVGSLQTGGENSFHIVGATLFDEGPESPARVLQVGESGIPLHGSIDTVAGTAALLGADRIVVASSPSARPEFVKQLSWQLEGTAADLVLSHRITDVVGPRISFKPVDGLPLLQIKIPSYEGGQHLLKRVLDICVATVALVPIALISPAIALLIKLDSRGPVLYRQERLGRDGQSFRMVKFRTMRTGADAELAALQAQNDGAGPLFKMRADPRVTRIGRVLRRFSLDELPQFWNVLTGEMSVVGPRPPLPREAQSYDGVVTRRLYIKPGITGLWQVSGRSDLSWDESVRLDLRYVENWSLMQDVQIMWRTARVMIHPTGAY